jgi:hypothetical protein
LFSATATMKFVRAENDDPITKYLPEKMSIGEQLENSELLDEELGLLGEMDRLTQEELRWNRARGRISLLRTARRKRAAFP